MATNELDVFINCPFDKKFKPLFEALLFTVQACGYNVRCALEEENGADLRFDKLCRLIEESPRSIHDLSRVELSSTGLPRFNMPFELGLLMGAKRFGSPRQKAKTALVMIDKPFEMPRYLSDLSGSDPSAHQGKEAEVVRLIRKYLHSRPPGAPLPGAEHIQSGLEQFRRNLPARAREYRFKPAELDCYDDYRTFRWFLTRYIEQHPVVD